MAEQVSIEEVNAMFYRLRTNITAIVLQKCAEHAQCEKCCGPLPQLRWRLNPEQIEIFISNTIKFLSEGEDNFRRMITILNEDSELRASFLDASFKGSWEDHIDFPRLQATFCADGRVYDEMCLLSLCGSMFNVYQFGLNVFENDHFSNADIDTCISETINLYSDRE